ncbi:MAG: hypothetical protein H6818_07590 [Phycisphaerales bacterium]|nr:hypothetical protein [Phycisphaerales bacterium]MCB9864187.1 hypothetical protein [Phycisphaerales bacterium]
MNTHRILAQLCCALALLIATPAFGQSPTPTKMSSTTTRQTRDQRATATAPAPAKRIAADRRSHGDHRAKHESSHRKSRKQKAKIDSLDAELRHDGCFWIVEIEYEVDLEGFQSDETFVLGLELLDDGKPVLDDEGQPIVVVVELNRPKKDKDSKLEFEGRLRMRVHKDWVRDDDDLEVKASLVRAADGQIFDVEDESAGLDRPGPTLHIGAYGIGISIPL